MRYILPYESDIVFCLGELLCAKLFVILATEIYQELSGQSNFASLHRMNKTNKIRCVIAIIY